MEYPSFLMKVHEDTIQLQRSYSHYMQVQKEMGVMGPSFACFHFVAFSH